MRYDPTALDLIAHQILNCVCAELDRVAAEAADLELPGCPCRVGVVPGGAVAWDNCCDDCSGEDKHQGQLTVSLGRVFPTTRFPLEERTVDICEPATLAATYVVTLLRCMPTMDNRGRPPSSEALARAAQIVSTDALTMQHAIACCVTRDENGKKRRVVITGHTPVGPGGGCTGTELTLVVDTKLACCPPGGS